MGKGDTSICIDCEKSCGLCSWSANLKPVPGWTATPVEKRISDGRIVKGYYITDCPKFEPTPTPSPGGTAWSEEETNMLREMMRQRVSMKNIAAVLNRSVNSVQGKMQRLREEKRNASR